MPPLEERGLKKRSYYTKGEYTGAARSTERVFSPGKKLRSITIIVEILQDKEAALSAFF